MSTISASTTSTTAYKVTADTTGTLVLQTGSTPTTAVTIGSDQSVTFAQGVNLPNTFGLKNRIINGGMVIDQRSAGASVTLTSSSYLLDRWLFDISAASKFSVQQSSVAPTGYTKSMLITSLSAYSVSSGDYFQASQPIEGFNVADLGFGAAGASTVTVSFWVNSSLTGTFGGCLKNGNSTRSYPFTYTISSANTWEQKTVTIAGDTTGTWATDSSRSMQLVFSIGMGSTYSGAAGSWAGANYGSATGATSLVGTNGATLYITGVQLEKGSTATSFDFRDYGTELSRCYRYFTKDVVGGLWNVTGWLTCPFPVTMRAGPTVTAAGAFGQSTPTVGSSTANFVLINASTIGFYASCSAEL